MPATLAFVRGGDGERGDRVYVTRHDGSEVPFRIWPSAAGLPHDLAGYGSESYTTDDGRCAAVAAACRAAGVGQPPEVDEAAITRLRALLTEEAAAWAQPVARRGPAPHLAVLTPATDASASAERIAERQVEDPQLQGWRWRSGILPGTGGAGRRAASRRVVAAATSSTAASKAGASALDGVRIPDSLRTYWTAASRTSSSVGSTSARCSGRMLRHMATILAEPPVLSGEGQR